jgi:hypothetical protein
VDRRLPASVVLAIRGAWGLVGLIGLTVVLMGAFYDQVLASWAQRHAGAREAFAAGGRAGLEQASIVPPAFLPVGATMFVVAAMLVWVLAAFFRQGFRWGQVGLTAVVAGCVFSSIALGFRLGPPPEFVVVAVLSLLVEGVTLIALWHRDTREYIAGPWADWPAKVGSGHPAGDSAGDGADDSVDSSLDGRTAGHARDRALDPVDKRADGRA